MRLFYINLAFFFLMSYTGYSQVDCITNPPIAPVLTNVSVQPETGYTDIRWELSPSTDIAAYILYTYRNGDGMAIDTIWDSNETHYTYTKLVTKYDSVSYVVTAMRLPRCTSSFSNVLNSIFCSSLIDTCNKELVVDWNGYPDYPYKVLEYKILVSENSGPLTERYSTDGNTRKLIISDFVTNSQYCFVVRAILEDGLVSNSNKSCLTTIMRRPPQWINAEFATVNDENKISLSFNIDPLSEITRFSLERKSGTSNIFQEIAQISSEAGSVLYTDNSADVRIVNSYRLSAVNSCNIPVTVSNISSNMILSIESTSTDLNMSWNSYKHWLGGIESYNLFVNTGSGFEDKAVINGADSLYTLGYRDIMYDVTGGEVCFYISASEKSNPYGFTGQSNSQVVCIVPTEKITVPNIFTPNNDLLNDLFRPVLSFTPNDYHLIISDYRGSVLFETRDHLEAWDGSHNGNPQPEGVCLWFLSITTPSGKKISKTGTLTIIHDKY